MESYIVKHRKSGKYFKVGFGMYNSINSFISVEKKEDATVFQPEGQILDFPNGGQMKVGNIRCSEFALSIHLSKINIEEIEVIKFDAPEQSIFTEDQQKEMREAVKQIEEIESGI